MMDDKNTVGKSEKRKILPLYTAKIDVTVPFEFCKHCNRLELEDYYGYLYATGEPIAHEYSCKHGYFCRNIIELYERSMEE